MVETLVRLGVDFWHARGVEPCPAPTVLIADSLIEDDGVDAAGRALDCRIWLRADLVRAAERERYKPEAAGHRVREALCIVVAHEVGHLAGLGHSETGIMAPAANAVPWECKVWRWALDREAKAQRARQGARTVRVRAMRQATRMQHVARGRYALANARTIAFAPRRV